MSNKLEIYIVVYNAVMYLRLINGDNHIDIPFDKAEEIMRGINTKIIPYQYGQMVGREVLTYDLGNKGKYYG